MKNIGPNVYREITDQETGATTLELDPTSKAVEYSDTDLKTWIEKSVVPAELGEFGLQELQRIQSEIHDWKTFFENNPNMTPEDRLEWFKGRKSPTKLELEKSFELLQYLIKNHEKLRLALEARSNSETFAIPSHPLMFSLLAMFAGKPDRIPHEFLDKPHNERTQEEKEQAERYLNNIFETKEEVDYSDGIKKTSKKRIALICNNARIEGKAEISWSLFQHCPSFREERLAHYIKKTFGPEGIRHLLGLITVLNGFLWLMRQANVY